MLTPFFVSLAVSLPLLSCLLVSLVKAQRALRASESSLSSWRRHAAALSLWGCACSAIAFVLMILFGLLDIGFSKAVVILCSRAFLAINVVTLALAAFATSGPRRILLIDNTVVVVLWFAWLGAITVP
jgi:hypothetical protein